MGCNVKGKTGELFSVALVPAQMIGNRDYRAVLPVLTFLSALLYQQTLASVNVFFL